MRTTALILAGGQGRRMGGRDKAFVLLAGRPLLAHVLERIAPQVGRVIVSANGAPERFAGLEVLADDETGQGPLAGVLAGLRAAQGPLLTVSVDTPFLPLDLASKLNKPEGAYARSAGRDHPTAALWHPERLPEIAALYARGERRLRAALGAAVPVDFADTPFDPFENINTPEDLARAETRLL